MENLNHSFEVRFNIDSSNLIVSSDITEGRNAFKKIKLSVIDENLKKRWSKEVEIPFDSKLVELTKIIGDKDANVYCVGKIKNEKQNYVTDYFVYQFNEDKKKQNAALINRVIDGRVIDEFDFHIVVETDELISVGFVELYNQRKNKRNCIYFPMILNI